MGFILIMQLFLLMIVLSFVHNFRETITTRNSIFYMRHYCFTGFESLVLFVISLKIMSVEPSMNEIN